MEELVVEAPIAGQVVSLVDVPDVVFSRGIVGPGVALAPEQTDLIVARAPISGQLVKIFPHAFMITQGENTVLVHLGIDTVRMSGHGFNIEAEEGSLVERGAAITTWQIGKAREAGYSVLCPVVMVDDSAPDLDLLVTPGQNVTAGEPLLKVY